MSLLEAKVFSSFSPFYFISQHFTFGYLLSLASIYTLFLVIWIKLAPRAALILAIFPFTPLFSYFFYASSNISILFALDQSFLGLFWLFCILLVFLISVLLVPRLRSLLNSRNAILIVLGRSLHKTSRSYLCFILFLLILVLAIYISYSKGLQQFNDPNRILYSFGGGVRKYIVQILLEPYLLLYTFSTFLTERRSFSIKNTIIFVLFMLYSVTVSFFSGSKSFILGFIFLLSLYIYSFNTVNRAFKSARKLRLTYDTIVIFGLFSIFLIVFFSSPLSRLVLYLIEYQFVSPVQCTAVVIKESIDPEKTIGANYFLLLFEPLHRFGVLEQYKPGNAINLASSYLIDSEYGGTNPSVFCHSTSEHFSSFFIPLFWAMFSSWFLACSSIFLTHVGPQRDNIHFSRNPFSCSHPSPLPVRNYYSRLGAVFLFFLIYRFGTPQAAWVHWILGVIYESIGIFLWVFLLNNFLYQKK